MVTKWASFNSFTAFGTEHKGLTRLAVINNEAITFWRHNNQILGSVFLRLQIRNARREHLLFHAVPTVIQNRWQFWNAKRKC